MNGRASIGIVGCGAVVEKYYLPALARCRDVQCELLIDRDIGRAETLAQAHAIARVAGDLTQAAGLVEGVVVAVPNHLHADMATQALGAGIHVLCEKPVARTVAELRSMLRVARECERGLFAAMVCRHYGSITEVAASQAYRLVEDPQELEGSYGVPLDWPVGSPAFYDRGLSGGGAMLDLGSHLVDAMLYALGFPSYEVVSYRDDADAGVESEAEARLRLFVRDRATPVDCTLRTSRLRRLPNALVLRGKRGALEVPLSPGAAPVLTLERTRWTMAAPSADIVACFAEQLTDFGRVIRGGESGLPAAESQLSSLGLIEALYRVREPLTFPWED